ncbi:MAG TPA: membrane protein insertase YidC [Caulobacteraceae bacterium]|nr:membrane protein insertase YidC [Caulobacteraceae bacterium]
MENDSNRNMMLFIVIAAAILMFYQFFVLGPDAKHREALAQAQGQAEAQHSAAAQAQAPVFSHAQALAAAPRVELDTPALTGSISLLGGRIDDVSLKRYHQGLDPHSPLVQMFAPAGADHAWYAEAGWQGPNVAGAPGDATLWTAQPGAVLTPSTPLVLTYDNGQGLKFVRTIAVDDNYMFTITDQVTNNSAAAVSLAQNAQTVQALPTNLNADKTLAHSGVVHEGAIGLLGGGATGKYGLELDKYADWKKKSGPVDVSSVGGWLGITEKYWLSALIPDQSTPVSAEFRVQPNGAVDFYQAGYVGQMHTVAPGASLTQSLRLFAGAKTVSLLRAYQCSGAPPHWFWQSPPPKAGDVPRFDQAVDWGMMFFLTQPLFDLLEFFNRHIGSIALSILALTVMVKAIFFPLANKSYESISKMKKIQPMVEDLKKKFGEDQAKLQQETMALYQREKINPLMGCLPLMFQIPVFYSLYKVLTVTIELRQAPFYGWIHDLSARDPTSIWNLFGAIPWDPAHAVLLGGLFDGPLHIGAWPLIYGFTMWLSQAMNPPPPDPTQKLMFQLMPIFFTYIMAQYTVGLLIYWTWSNLLSILQQYVIMHRYQVGNPIDDFIGRFRRPKAAAV